MLFIPGYELIVTTSRDASKIRVFPNGTARKPKLIFKHHREAIAGTIYLQAASFKMGDRDWNIMVLLVKEAEEAGVIEPGRAQDLFC